LSTDNSCCPLDRYTFDRLRRDAHAKDEVRIALIGAGYAGQAHAFGYRNAAMSDALGGVSVVLDTVADPNLELVF